MKSGFKVIHTELRSILKAEHTLLKKTLGAAALDIENDAKAIVPLRTGKLQDSIEVKVSGSPRYPGIIASASAQNDRTGYNYAAIQHENPNYHHDSPRQYKYLEQPVNKAVDKIMEEL